LGNRPAGQHGFQRVAQVVGRDDGPPPAQSSILVVDSSAIEEVSRGRKQRRFGSGRRLGAPDPDMLAVQCHRGRDLVLLRVLPGHIGRRHRIGVYEDEGRAAAAEFAVQAVQLGYIRVADWTVGKNKHECNGLRAASDRRAALQIDER
jgi:hypothetical protein